MGSKKDKLADRIAALEKSLAREKAKRGRLEAAAGEAREQQAATSEILRVIATSPGDGQPVFDAIVSSAARLCDADFSAVARFDGGLLHLVSLNNMSAAGAAAFHVLFPRPAERDFVMGRAFLEGHPVHVEDIE